MKYIPLSKIYINLQYFQVTLENKTQGSFNLSNVHENKINEIRKPQYN